LHAGIKEDDATRRADAAAKRAAALFERQRQGDPRVERQGKAEGPQPRQMSTTADDIEFGITRLPRGGVKATVHIFRGGRWWPPEVKLCISEGPGSRAVGACEKEGRLDYIENLLTAARAKHTEPGKPTAFTEHG
jgi:hypothetical protein